MFISRLLALLDREHQRPVGDEDAASLAYASRQRLVRARNLIGPSSRSASSSSINQD